MSILDMDQNGRISCPAEGPGARSTVSFPTIWPAKYILWTCVAGLDGWFTRNHRRCHMSHIHSEQLQRPLWSLSAGVGNVEVHGVLSCCAWAEIIIEWCCWIEGTAPDMFGICIVSLYVFPFLGPCWQGYDAWSTWVKECVPTTYLYFPTSQCNRLQNWQQLQQAGQTMTTYCLLGCPRH